MKKTSTILAIFLLLIVNGQNFKYGLTGNIHKSSIVGVHDVSKGKYGGGLGAFAQWSLVENDVFDSAWLFITPQIEYSMQGENAKADKDIFGVQKYHNDYVAMQVYLKWFFHQGNMKRDVFLFAGPRIEYQVRKYKKVDGGYDEAYYDFNQDLKMKKFGYGASFGIGLKVNQQFETFLRYDRGFSKIYPDNVNHNTYNRLLGLGLNFYFVENWW